MKRPFKLLLPVAAALAVAACNAGTMSTLPGSPTSAVSQASGVLQWEAMHPAHRACPEAPRGYMSCDVLVEDNAGPNAGPVGWEPPVLEGRYNLPSKTRGAGQLVAIVDAYDNPNVTSDLAEYRKEFKLGSVKFKKLNQEGQAGNYPAGSPGWGVEIDLDVEMVSASCPKCSIDLLEADDNSGNNLYAAEIEAVKLGAKIVSNSWGGGGGSSSGGAFDTKHIVYIASAGDGGYGTQDPADYTTVVSVGGTFLTGSGKNYQKYNEVVWPESGGGCSVVAKPPWQKDPKCNKRTDNDVSAVSVDAAEYDTYDKSGWIPVDGTSISAPLVAGMYGLAENATKLEPGAENIWKLSKTDISKDFHYIKTGNLSGCPASLENTYLCAAGTKEFGNYSGPDGWGTPYGIAAF